MARDEKTFEETMTAEQLTATNWKQDQIPESVTNPTVFSNSATGNSLTESVSSLPIFSAVHSITTQNIKEIQPVEIIEQSTMTIEQPTATNWKQDQIPESVTNPTVFSNSATSNSLTESVSSLPIFSAAHSITTQNIKEIQPVEIIEQSTTTTEQPTATNWKQDQIPEPVTNPTVFSSSATSNFLTESVSSLPIFSAAHSITTQNIKEIQPVEIIEQSTMTTEQPTATNWKQNQIYESVTNSTVFSSSATSNSLTKNVSSLPISSATNTMTIQNITDKESIPTTEQPEILYSETTFQKTMTTEQPTATNWKQNQIYESVTNTTPTAFSSSSTSTFLTESASFLPIFSATKIMAIQNITNKKPVPTTEQPEILYSETTFQKTMTMEQSTTTNWQEYQTTKSVTNPTKFLNLSTSNFFTKISTFLPIASATGAATTSATTLQNKTEEQPGEVSEKAAISEAPEAVTTKQSTNTQTKWQGKKSTGSVTSITTLLNSQGNKHLTKNSTALPKLNAIDALATSGSTMRYRIGKKTIETTEKSIIKTNTTIWQKRVKAQHSETTLKQAIATSAKTLRNSMITIKTKTKQKPLPTKKNGESTLTVRTKKTWTGITSTSQHPITMNSFIKTQKPKVFPTVNPNSTIYRTNTSKFLKKYLNVPTSNGNIYPFQNYLFQFQKRILLKMV